MKKSTLDATNENIWNSIRNNEFDRICDICNFIDLLECLEGNVYISLDADWGAGKTFFVRQVEESLKFCNKYSFNKESLSSLPSYKYLKDCSHLKNIELKQSYLPVYYNAWLYDSHHDPLLSLISIIVKSCTGVFETKLDPDSLKSKVVSLSQAISPFIKEPSLAVATASAGALSSSAVDILDSIQTEEEIRECIKKIFDEAISEHANKMVVFIDELDRCRPNFAVEMLEKIKHYFSDDRIIFVVSTNKEQLSHTIKRYYGDEFDATRYLNKFFDLNIGLPKIKYPLPSYTGKPYWLNSIASELIHFYNLPLREILIFLDNLSRVSTFEVNDGSNLRMLYSLFVPIMILLDMKDTREYNAFVNGKSNVLDELFDSIEHLQDFARYFDRSENKDEQKSFEEIKKAYQYIFSPNILPNYPNPFKIPDDAKEQLWSFFKWA